jgi:hypothetical protein
LYYEERAVDDGIFSPVGGWAEEEDAGGVDHNDDDDGVDWIAWIFLWEERGLVIDDLEFALEIRERRRESFFCFLLFFYLFEVIQDWPEGRWSARDRSIPLSPSLSECSIRRGGDTRDGGGSLHRSGSEMFS